MIVNRCGCEMGPGELQRTDRDGKGITKFIVKKRSTQWMYICGQNIGSLAMKGLSQYGEESHNFTGSENHR